MSDNKTSKRGFLSMSPEKLQEITSQGGKSVPPEKRAFSQNRELAREAGRKGGLKIPKEERSFSKNRKLASEAGRKGGVTRARKAEAARGAVK